MALSRATHRAPDQRRFFSLIAQLLASGISVGLGVLVRNNEPGARDRDRL
jgi:hypothetical protein